MAFSRNHAIPARKQVLAIRDEAACQLIDIEAVFDFGEKIPLRRLRFKGV